MKKGGTLVYGNRLVNPILSARAFAWKLLSDASNAWNWSWRRIILMWVVPFLISLAAIVGGLLSKDLYAWLVTEDGLFEYMGVGFYALVFVGSLQISWRFYKLGDKLLTFLYIGLSFAMFFMVGEELGWGQRIFGWQTPESFVAINKQSETTLHNIYGVEDAFKWLQMLVGAYGTVLPLATLFIHVKGRLGAIIRRIVPHYSLIPYFAIIFFWKIFRAVYSNPKSYEWAITEYNEVTELILGIGLFLFFLYQIRIFKSETKKPAAENWAVS